MSIDLALTIALDLCFYAVLALTVREYLRHREPVRLLVVLVFASLGVVLATAPIRAIVPAAGPLLSLLAVPALLAQPVLVLWLASMMRPLPRGMLAAATVAFVALSAALLALTATGQLSSGGARSPWVTALLLGLLGYFLVVEGTAAVAIALAARGRAGASRTRLGVAAVATGLFVAALVLVIAGSLLGGPGSAAAGALSLLGRLTALLSALGYLVAFAPPRALRRLSQQAILYDFIRELNAVPSGSPVERIWELLASTLLRASGASRVQVVTGRGDGPPAAVARGRRTVAVPFTSLRWPQGRLEMDLAEHALFLEDDLELAGILVDRGVRAAEREAFLVEREQLISELRAASAAKSDFLAAMSHELRTPLNAIIGFSELLQEGGEDVADPATVVSYSDHIHGSGLHLLELVNDVLDLARVEAGRLELRLAEFPLDELVRQAVATVEPLASQKRLSLTVDAASTSIEADSQRVRQVVLNLLSNAIKFTPEGGSIRVSLTRGEDDAAVLTVADTGRGIAAADLERVFEAFQQAGEEAKVRHEGTGLGLALTRQLVEAHGGAITVRSEPDAGSQFTVTLPARRGATAAAAPPVVPIGRPVVLVIEDDPAAQELLRHHLEGAGYAVVSTASGRQGVAWMAELKPDAVVLDILLPDIDGWEVLQRAKGSAATRSVPIMIVSVVDDRQLGLALGAVDYFVKPVSRDPLLEALGRLTFTTKVRTQTVTALVIDADAEAADRYRALLEPDGFRVIAARDGSSGRHAALAEHPDLILLDALLPDMDGLELAGRLHGDPATTAIPIWVTTPSELAPEAKARLNGMVQGVLVKGDDALVALRAWLATKPHAPSVPIA